MIPTYNLGIWNSSSHTQEAKGLLRRISQDESDYLCSSNIQGGTLGRKLLYQWNC